MRAFVIAGEASGDKLGGALMAGLHQENPGVEFDGVGGPEMTAQGLSSRFPMDELSVMGIAEVLPKYRALKARIRQCAQWVIETEPDVLITIDSPDFCLRVARLVKQARPGLRTVHYVAPSVWAWREKRADKMAKVIDQVLCLLPFEPPLMEKTGMRADFVGHPVVSEPQATQEEAARFRAAHKIAPDASMVLILPGSRRGEVERLAPRFGEAAGLIAKEVPEARFVVPSTANVAGLLEEQIATWAVDAILLDPRSSDFDAFMREKRAAFAAADVALAASGTVSLELAAADTPMVIAYDMNWISRLIISSMLKIDTVTLVNLVSETRSVPEFLGKEARPETIAPAVVDLLRTPENAQMKALHTTMARLGKGGDAPGLRAARAVLDGLRG